MVLVGGDTHDPASITLHDGRGVVEAPQLCKPVQRANPVFGLCRLPQRFIHRVNIERLVARLAGPGPVVVVLSAVVQTQWRRDLGGLFLDELDQQQRTDLAVGVFEPSSGVHEKILVGLGEAAEEGWEYARRGGFAVRDVRSDDGSVALLSWV